MKKIYSSAAVGLVIAVLAGCKRDDQIQTYQASKDQVPATPAMAPPAGATPSTPSMMGADAASVPFNSAPVRWATPAGWKENPPSSIRLGDFTVPGPDGKTATITIISLADTGGGPLANVTRWRGEVGLAPIAESDITSEKVVVDGSEGQLYDFPGATERTVVADIMRDGASWFIKMKGDAPTVAAAKPVYLDFLKTIHFSAGAAAPAPMMTAGDPHATMPAMSPGMGGGSAATMALAINPGELPKWTAPAGWTETTPGQLVTKSFVVMGDGGQKAAVTISVLNDIGGGLLLNVQRWCRQLQVPEITEEGLPKATETMDVLGGSAMVVKLTGTDATGQPAQMVAAIVTHTGKSWFYKLMGAPAVVTKEKENFLNFVQTVRYP